MKGRTAVLLPLVFDGRDGAEAAAMLDRWTPEFTRKVPSVVHENARALAEELVAVGLRRVPGASSIGPLEEHFGSAVHFPDHARIRDHREIDDALLNGMILTLHEELQAVWVQSLVRALTCDGTEPFTPHTWNLLLDTVGPVVVNALTDTLMYRDPDAPGRKAEVEIRIDPQARLTPPGPATAVSRTGDVRGHRTVALDQWWDRGDSLLLSLGTREALTEVADAAVAALARLTTREGAVLRVDLPEISRPEPANVVPIDRDSAVLRCTLSAPEESAPREVVSVPVTVHRTARELGFILAGPVDTVHALWAPALATAAQAHDAAHGEPPWMEKVVNASLRDYAEAEG